jgi:O-antigen ligase
MADRFRVRGLFKDPNVFGPFFVPGILIMLNDFKQKKVFKIHGIFHIIMILCMSLGVLFSFSRGAWVNLGVSLFIYAILNIKTLSASVKGQFAAAALLLGISCLIAAPYFTKTELWAFLQERARFQDYDAM